MADAARPQVRHLRQALLWPLRLMVAPEARSAGRSPWQLLSDQGEASPWREVVDEFTGAAGSFQERHYNEFVTFLPYVQRFLYGAGRAGHAGGDAGAAPMRVLRRRDIVQLRETMERMRASDADAAPRDAADREFHLTIAQATVLSALEYRAPRAGRRRSAPTGSRARS